MSEQLPPDAGKQITTVSIMNIAEEVSRYNEGKGQEEAHVANYQIKKLSAAAGGAVSLFCDLDDFPDTHTVDQQIAAVKDILEGDVPIPDPSGAKKLMVREALDLMGIAVSIHNGEEDYRYRSVSVRFSPIGYDWENPS